MNPAGESNLYTKEALYSCAGRWPGTIILLARFILKRKALLVLLAIGLAAMVSAQGMGRGQMSPRLPPAEAVTVSGSLIVAHGSPALKSGDVTYIVGGINRLTGFVDGLKEGAQVTIEGQAIASPRDNTLKFLRPVKLTFGGKTYDMAPLGPAGGFRQFAPSQGTNRQQAPYAPQGRQRRPMMKSM